MGIELAEVLLYLKKVPHKAQTQSRASLLVLEGMKMEHEPTKIVTTSPVFMFVDSPGQSRSRN